MEKQQQQKSLYQKVMLNSKMLEAFTLKSGIEKEWMQSLIYPTLYWKYSAARQEEEILRTRNKKEIKSSFTQKYAHIKNEKMYK